MNRMTILMTTKRKNTTVCVAGHGGGLYVCRVYPVPLAMMTRTAFEIVDITVQVLNTYTRFSVRDSPGASSLLQ